MTQAPSADPKTYIVTTPGSILTGGSGSDLLNGAAGNDTISGAEGDDTLIGGAGDDLLYGGKGTDNAQYAGSYANFTLTPLYDSKNAVNGYQLKDKTGAEGTDTLDTTIEYLVFDSGKSVYSLSNGKATLVNSLPTSTLGKTVQGTAANDTLSGGDGNDTLIGGAGNDQLSGGNGDDAAQFTGSYTNFTITNLYDSKNAISGYQIKDNAGSEGTDTLDLTVEYLTFDSGKTLYSIADGKIISLPEDTAYTFTASDFGIGDSAANKQSLLKISSLPAKGQLKYNGTAITPAQVSSGYEVSAADLAAGKLSYLPVANDNGDLYSNFAFQVRANSSAQYGVADLNSFRNKISFDVTAVNDKPAGAVTISGVGDVGATLTAANSLSDLDGLGTISYQWLRSGKAINGAIDKTYQVSTQDATESVSVQASYVDGYGTLETVRSIDSLLILPKPTIDKPAVKGSIAGTAADDVFDTTLYITAKYLGGKGNDSYIVSSAAAKLTESANQGTDTVYANVSFTLPVNVENLKLYGNSPALVATGNKSNNLIIGNAADNTLVGLEGNDTLTGGPGKDTFVFNTTPNAKTNLDTITDFNGAEDVIGLKASVFKKLGSSVDASELWLKGQGSQTPTQYLIYDPVAGTVSYDADGNGKGAAINIAVIGAHLDLTIANFSII